MVIGLLSCDKSAVAPVASTCYPSVNATRSHRIIDAAVTVQASGGLATGYRPYRPKFISLGHEDKRPLRTLHMPQFVH